MSSEDMQVVSANLNCRMLPNWYTQSQIINFSKWVKVGAVDSMRIRCRHKSTAQELSTMIIAKMSQTFLIPNGSSSDRKFFVLAKANGRGSLYGVSCLFYEIQRHHNKASFSWSLGWTVFAWKFLLGYLLSTYYSSCAQRATAIVFL